MQALRARIAGSPFGFAPFGRDGFSTISDRDPIPAQPKSIDSGLDRSAQACSAPFRSWDPIELPRENWRRSEEHTSELQSRFDLVCRLLLEKKKNNNIN